MSDDLKTNYAKLNKRYQEIKKQLAITEKALELACEELWCMSIWKNTKEEVIQDYIQCFKTKAKEMLENE